MQSKLTHQTKAVVELWLGNLIEPS
jgi:hypothetical protein